MFENAKSPFMKQILEGGQNHNLDRFHFQKDGAPPHYDAPATVFLENQFPGRWIGRKGSNEWSAGSSLFFRNTWKIHVLWRSP